MRHQFRTVLFGIAALLVVSRGAGTSQGVRPTGTRPRLAVLVVVDQMRVDYLERYKDRFTDGFKRLRDGGAFFAEARYPYARTETSPGHATILTGRSPSLSGIEGNAWFDRQSGKTINAGESFEHPLLGTRSSGGSPEQLLVHTLGDELKRQSPGALVMVASWKRYASILLGGHHADAAYWYDPATGRMVTSDYYRRALPAWVSNWNKVDYAGRYFGKRWLTQTLGDSVSAPNEAYRTAFRVTPYANDMVLGFTTAMLKGTRLGIDRTPDILGVSFSATDYAGHLYGPETPQFDDTIVAMDRQLGDLMRILDKRVGRGRYVLALVADHGAAFLPEKNRERGEDAGRLEPRAFQATIVKSLAAKFGSGEGLIRAFEAPELYLNYAEAAKRQIDAAALDDAVVAAATAQPGIARAFTAAQLEAAASSDDPLLKAVADSYYPGRSGDIYLLVKPNYIFWGAVGTHHGTPYEYDQHVPLFFYGQGVNPGVVARRVQINDLAPTLGALIGVEFKGGPTSTVLHEALSAPPATSGR